MAAVRDQMKAQNFPEQDIRDGIKINVIDIYTKIKINTVPKTIPEESSAGFLEEISIARILAILSCYSQDYAFKKDSIHYDVKVNPSKHLRAFYTIAKICEEANFKSFNCFPLRKGFIPAYITMC